MYTLYIPPAVEVQIYLVLYGTGRDYVDRSTAFDDLMILAKRTLQLNPRSGESRLVDGVEVLTLHLRQPGRPAHHQFLYRIVGKVVEVAHLLHDDMPIHLHV